MKLIFPIIILLSLLGLWKQSIPQGIAEISELRTKRPGIYEIEGKLISNGGSLLVSDKNSSISVFGNLDPISDKYRIKVNKTHSGFNLISAEPLTLENEFKTGWSTNKARISGDKLIGEIETRTGKIQVKYSDQRGIF